VHTAFAKPWGRFYFLYLLRAYYPSRDVFVPFSGFSRQAVMLRRTLVLTSNTGLFMWLQHGVVRVSRATTTLSWFSVVGTAAPLTTIVRRFSVWTQQYVISSRCESYFQGKHTYTFMVNILRICRKTCTDWQSALCISWWRSCITHFSRLCYS